MKIGGIAQTKLFEGRLSFGFPYSEWRIFFFLKRKQNNVSFLKIQTCAVSQVSKSLEKQPESA